MTKEELIAGLKDICAKEEGADIGYGPEEAHAYADDLLLEYINDELVTDAFDKIKKWYA